MRTAPILRAVAGVAVVLTGAAGCSSNAEDADDDAVAVTATDTACAVDSTDLAAGPTTFTITNDGEQATGVYVYGEGDIVEGALEDIGPGTTRDLTVDLGEGSYEMACKPGMAGEGIRTEITVGS